MASSQSLFNTEEMDIDTSNSEEMDTSLPQEEQKLEEVSSPSDETLTYTSPCLSHFSQYNTNNKFPHNPTDPDELIPINNLGGDLIAMIADYLDGDVMKYSQGPEKFSAEKYQRCRLFGRVPKDLVYDTGSPEAANIANLILQGEEKDVEQALSLVKENPNLLRTECRVTDRVGHCVLRTPFQIAAMAGDVDLRDGIKKKKDRGLVERLKLVAKLSDEEAAEQLYEVLFSEEAIKENERRNTKILNAIKSFSKKIIENEYKGDDDNFEEFQTSCQEFIDHHEKELTPNPNEVIRFGYLFDTAILAEAAKWFNDNVQRFGGWSTLRSDVFWVNGFGKLQSKLSSRDAQVTREGIGRYMDNKVIPSRTLNNADGASYFYNSDSGLGRDFYLGYYGWDVSYSGAGLGVLFRLWNSYVEQKQQRCKTYATSGQVKEQVFSNVIRR